MAVSDHEPERAEVGIRAKARVVVRQLVGRSERLGAALAWVITWMARLSERQVGLIVMYHGVTHSPEPLSIAPVVDSRQFAEDLRRFCCQYLPVPLERLDEAIIARRRGGRIPIAITFDDDLDSHVRVALPLLEQAGVHATFFVGGDEQACRRSYWWEPLQRALERGIALPEHPALVRTGRDPERLATAMLELTQQERQAVTEELWRELAPDEPPAHLSIEGLSMLVQGGQQIGFHTRDHRVLTDLNSRELSDALTLGLSNVAEIAGYAVRTLAYPHGITDDRVSAAAAAAGFVRGLTCEACGVTPTTDPLRLGRVDADAGSSALLALRLARALVRGLAP